MTRSDFENRMIAALKAEPGLVDSLLASFLGVRAGMIDRCGFLAYLHEVYDGHEAAILNGEEVTEDDALEVGA